MKSAQATKEIQAAAVAKRIEEEQERQRQKQEQQRIELERRARRQAASRRRKELASNVDKRVAKIIDDLWIAAGEGHYQFWAGRLAKAERKLLADRGLSMRTISAELEQLDQDYKKIWGHVLMSDRYVEDKNTFLSWLASEMGLSYDKDLDDVIDDKDEWNEPEIFQQRSDVFDQITIDLGLRYSLIAEKTHDGYLVTAKRCILERELLVDAIWESAFCVEHFMQRKSHYLERCLDLPLSVMLPDHASSRLLNQYRNYECRNWLFDLDLDGWQLKEHLSPLAWATLTTEELSAEDHLLMGRVKKQCLEWCDHYLVDEGVRENGWVVSWWDSIFTDIQEESCLSHQLAWLSSKDVQAALEEVERKIEEAASLEQCQVTIALDDTFGTAALFASLVVQYLNRLGYQCEMLQKPDEICISWAMAAG